MSHHSQTGLITRLVVNRNRDSQRSGMRAAKNLVRTDLGWPDCTAGPSRRYFGGGGFGIGGGSGGAGPTVHCCRNEWSLAIRCCPYC